MQRNLHFQQNENIPKLSHVLSHNLFGRGNLLPTVDCNCDFTPWSQRFVNPHTFGDSPFPCTSVIEPKIQATSLQYTVW